MAVVMDILEPGEDADLVDMDTCRENIEDHTVSIRRRVLDVHCK